MKTHGENITDLIYLIRNFVRKIKTKGSLKKFQDKTFSIFFIVTSYKRKSNTLNLKNLLSLE